MPLNTGPNWSGLVIRMALSGLMEFILPYRISFMA